MHNMVIINAETNRIKKPLAFYLCKKEKKLSIICCSYTKKFNFKSHSKKTKFNYSNQILRMTTND